jgi:Spy/CpxP family protein refolding chaperone
MRRLFTLLPLVLAIAPWAPLGAQVHSHDHTSPYTGLLDREIKALSDDEIRGLLAGEGMGMALAAELNRYPGPRHVLDMGPMLGLSQEQEASIRAVFEEMQKEATALGSEIVELERELDRSFAEGAITELRLEELLESIGQSRARLRFTHLRAHLELLPLLTESQRERYERARGYGG